MGLGVRDDKVSNMVEKAGAIQSRKETNSSVEEQTMIYRPYYSSPPNQVTKQWKERFDDGAGHTATLIKVEYTDGKKSRVAVAHVVWDWG